MNVIEGDVECVAGAHETGSLAGGVDVEHAGELRRLVAHHADGMAVQACEPAHDVARVVLVNLEELPVVDDPPHHLAHVIGLVGAIGNHRVELGVLAQGIVGGLDARRRLEVVLGQEREQVARVLDADVLVVGGKMGHARLGRVTHRAAELLEGGLLASDRLDHVGSGDEHVRGLLDHEDEVGHRGGVDGSARAGAHDQADLGDHAAAHHVAHEHVPVGPQRDDTLLDPSPARVVDANYRAADLGRQVHHLAHLLGHDFSQRAAEDREVLTEHAYPAPVDRAMAGDHRVAPRPVLLHVEVRRAVAYERIELLERTGIEQLVDPFASGVLALLVLLGDRGRRAGVNRLLAQVVKLGELFLVGLRGFLTHLCGGRVYAFLAKRHVQI